ncbi:flagellar protein [Xanthomonas oryzae pv. oryzae KACC 10331]|uniref:Flagellar assembly protein FliH n=1 Tax=Xanthomonas oryzae pv. oryzae (strain KACC10331 / KXO85) TaxID=291331 RepID=Q5GZL4_XANOR|nr:FliH/SctL family protein [Xanthomonas oryzae]AAW75857.1 flagellar protein [Xanthomonas oryzae pv. oryzae KACC 10331]
MNDVVTRWLAPDLHLVPAGPETEFDEAAVYEPVLRAPTLEEIQAIEDAAQQEGFARGHAEGFAQGQSEVRRLTAQIDGILDNFTHPLARLENEVVGAVGQLVGRAYQADPQLLAELVGEAVDAVGGAGREVEVRLHPDDITALLPYLAPSSTTRVAPDMSLSRGDLRVHAESVRIDGTLDARLRAALETVMRKSGAGL